MHAFDQIVPIQPDTQGAEASLFMNAIELVTAKVKTHRLLHSLVSWRGATEIVRVASIVAENRQQATLFAESRAHLKWLVLFQSSCRFITAN